MITRRSLSQPPFAAILCGLHIVLIVGLAIWLGLRSCGYVTLRNEVDAEVLERELAGLIHGTIQPTHVSIWTGSELREEHKS